ncbi:MAG: hypothetical protein K2O15_11600 [Lachnospiraceae bacterium]|nr:hypothetical protein [Lachnospiraceae bacterium]
MTDEKDFHYQNYIQEQLKRIDDLDERRFAKQLLTESLGRAIAWSEEKYAALERRIQNELDVPWRYFHVCMTVIEKTDYDPINTFWLPVCEEDTKKIQGQSCETVYLAADEQSCKEFLKMDTLTGVCEATGETVSFKIRPSERYWQSMDRLYRLFISNHVPWQTVHMGHMERFFDLIPETEEGQAAGTDWVIQDDMWNMYVRRGMMLLWNIRQSAVHSREYRVPCIDEVFYEHVFYLPQEEETEDGYLVDAVEDILSIRYEQNRIVLKTKAETLEDIKVYRLGQGEPEQSAGYRFPVLSNQRKDSLSARYSHRMGNFIQTPAELKRKVEEMADGYRISLTDYEILDRAEEAFLEGDMNSFTGVRLFTDDQRKILLLRFQAYEGEREDYLYESQVRYILSQLQMECLEYRCMGILEGENQDGR